MLWECASDADQFQKNYFDFVKDSNDRYMIILFPHMHSPIYIHQLLTYVLRACDAKKEKEVVKYYTLFRNTQFVSLILLHNIETVYIS